MGAQASKPDAQEPTLPISTKAADNDGTESGAGRAEADDEPDEWDKRIFSTGCADENMRMTDCYYAKKDWRACAKEMEEFKQCWKRQGNDQRVSTKDT